MLLRVLICLALVWSGPLRADPVVVFAASSLRTGLDAVLDGFEGDVAVSYASSATLARQIAAGAPADVFVSANGAWMDWLVAQGAVDPARRHDLLTNRLVWAVPSGGALGAPRQAVEQGARIAVGFVEAVPAGIYAKQALVSLGLWDRAAPNLVQVDNVRTALALVALGEVPLGLVYATDAQAEPRVRAAAEIGPEHHEAIVYPVAATARAGAEALALLHYLRSDAALGIFQAHGFGVPEGP